MSMTFQEFDMASTKQCATPMNDFCISYDESRYRGMIISLLINLQQNGYIISVCLCAHYQACPKESHLKVEQRILEYLKVTIKLRCPYLKSINSNLKSYSDANFAGCQTDRMSTNGTCEFLGYCLQLWFNKKQSFVVLSTMEAKILPLDVVVLRSYG